MKENLEKVVAPLLHELDLTLYDVEFVRAASRHTLRIFIDKDGGVCLDDCEVASRRISDALDRADIIQAPYDLEVSSPGVERKLIHPSHFSANIGQNIKLKLFAPRPMPSGHMQKVFTGVLEGFSDEAVTILLSDGQKLVVSHGDIALCRLCVF